MCLRSKLSLTERTVDDHRELPARYALWGARFEGDWLPSCDTTWGDATSRIPLKSNRKAQIPYDHSLYRKRHKIDNTLVKFKDRWRIHTHYERCAHPLTSAICIAATVIFWI